MSSLIPTFEQIPYNALVTRIDSGSQGLFELTNLFVERKELEEKNVLHSAKVSRSNIYEYEINNSSCERVLGFFKNYHLFLSKAQVKHHKAFGDVIIKDLDDLKLSRAANVNKHKVAVQNCLRDVTNAEDALDKAKKSFSKAKADLERSKIKLIGAEAAVVEAQRLFEEKKKENMGKETTNSNKFSMGRMLSAFESTPEQERDKLQRKVDRRSQEVASCLQQIFEKKSHLMEKIASMDATLQKAHVAFQEVEHERLVRLKTCMRNFCELERSAISARSELLTTLEEAIASQDADQDLSLFIAQEKHVELTHKYTSAIGLMDLHLKKSEEELSREQFISDRAPLESSDDLLSLVVEEGNSRIPDDYEKVSDADVICAVEEDAKNAPGEVDDAGSSVSSATLDVTDVEAVVSGSSVATSGDLKLVHRMSGALAGLFPTATPSSSGRNDDRMDASAGEVSVLGESGLLLSEAEWRDLISFRATRELFLQELDEQRGRRSTLSAAGFQSMGTAMKVLLDYCDAMDDSKSAMRVTNMANTFHTIDVNTEIASPSVEPSVEPVSEFGISDSTTEGEVVHVSESIVPLPSVLSYKTENKRYLQTEARLSRHPIWRKAGFWELALLEGIVNQMGLSEQPILWDELSPDALREAVIGVHNIVFGQLCALSFAMHELGLAAEEVEHNVLQMSRRAQLTEDQEHELVRSVRVTYGIPVPPIPVLDENNINLVTPDAVPPVVRAVGTVVSGGTTLAAHPPSQTAPILVVGRVISSRSDSTTKTDSTQAAAVRRPSESQASHSAPPSSVSAPPPLPPPLSPSLAQAQPPVGGEARKRVSVTAEGQSTNGNYNTTTIPAALIGTKPPITTTAETTPISDNSFLSYFSRNNKGATGSATPGGSAKTTSTKSASTSGKRPSVGKGSDHDDFFAVL